MFNLNLILAAALPALALAYSPSAQNLSAFTILALNGFASLHGPPPAFYFDPLRNYNYTVTINGNATTYCPPYLAAEGCCPPGTETVFNTTSAALYSGAASMPNAASLTLNSEVPYGQHIYVTPTGLLKFTRPFEFFPPGSQYNVFTSTHFDFDGLETFLLGFKDNTTAFYACHAPSNAATTNLYHVYAAIPAANLTGCLPFSAIAVPYNASFNQGWTKNGYAAFVYE